MTHLKHDKYKVWKLPNPLLIHWILNPGLAFNELILGQRIPKETLIDQTSEAPLTERSYVECPDCGTIHSSQLWGKGNSFWHFDGLYCPTCEAKIRTLLNVFSILLLVITFPVWKPIQMLLRDRLKAWELSRFDHSAVARTTRPDQHSGLKSGAIFGLAMGLFFIIQSSMRSGFGMQAFAIGLLAGLASGTLFGLAMSWVSKRRLSSTDETHNG